MDTFGKEALETHNKLRAAHQAPALKWSSALAREAEVWAKQIARDGRLHHDNTSDGENVFMVFGREIDGSDAVNSWYSEVKDYDFNKPGYQPKTGHFTQVVWKGSEELGIGKAKSADGKMFVVGRYRTAGNNLRAFQENVFPSKVRIEADITFFAFRACGLKLLCYNASIFRLYHSTATRVIVSSGLTTSKRVEIQKCRVILTEPLEQYVRSVSVEYFFNRLRNKANSINVLKTTLFDFFFLQ